MSVETYRCERCGAGLLPGGQGELCPACALESGLTEEPTAACSDNLAADEAGQSARPLRNFGDYELLTEIARGGQGVVYRARQKSLNRLVALKMLSLGPWATEAHFKRFKTEAEAAANLDHSEIVPIYEIGCIEGQHYFTMRLIDGGSLRQTLAGGEIGPHRAGEIITAVARAVHFAHQRGILHRDIKPGNILLDSRGQPHITDFGLAKLVEKESTVTNTMDVLGTPSYMSPEQAAGHTKQLTTAADIYGLGAVLYELLTGHPPFAGGTTLETIRLVLDKEPRRPSLWNPEVDRDLETICLKCLEKEPQRRYGSAEALAEDLQRWLRHEPIQARTISSMGRLWRWCKRKPVVAALSGATILLLLAVAIGSPVAAFRIAGARQAERREAARAEQHARDLRRNLYVADMNVAYQALQEDNLGKAKKLVYKYLPDAAPNTQIPNRKSKILNEDDLLGWEWRYLWALCQGVETSTFRGHTNFASCVVFSPDGQLLSTAGDWSIKISDPRSNQVITTLDGFNEWIDQRAVAFSADGKYLAAKGGNVVLIWRVGDWSSPYRQLEGAKNFNFNNAVKFWPDGKTFATRVRGGLGLWDTTTWQTNLLEGNDNFGTVLEFSRDGATLAISDWNTVQIWDANSLSVITNLVRQVATPDVYTARVMAASYSPGYLAAGYRDGELRLWELGSWRECGVAKAHPSSLWALAFSPDGKTLATGGSDQVVLLWNVAELVERSASGQSPKPIRKLRGHLGAIWALAFAPDGQTLVSGSMDGTVKFWNAIHNDEAKGLAGSREPIWFSADEKQLRCLSGDGRLHSWDTASRTETRVIGPQLDDHVKSPVYGIVRSISMDGRIFALGTTNGVIELWNLRSGQLEKQLQADNIPISYLAFSQGNGLLAAASDRLADTGWQGSVRLWNLAKDQRQPEHIFENAFAPMAFSSDGRRLIMCQTDGAVVVLDVQSHRRLATLKGHWEWVHCLAVSPDGTLLATGSGDTVARIWDLNSGKELYVLAGNRVSIGGLQFSSDGKTLVTTTVDNASKFWNVATGKELFTIEQLIPSRAVLFSPKGSYLALVGNAGGRAERQVELLRAPAFEEIVATERARAEKQP